MDHLDAIMASPVFTVERRESQLIPPSTPTPYEIKYLSNLDNQKGLWKHNFIIQFYRNSHKMEGRDPVKIFKEAIAKTLAHYYPFAGRLREDPNGKLVIECTSEGILFTEANASITLDQFGDVLLPPFSFELLYDVPGSGGVLDCPLFLIQVTRLRCGGFVFAFRYNHIIGDGAGIFQFMSALGEIACGARFPSVKPIWERELLRPRKPHQLRQAFCNTGVVTLPGEKIELVCKSFFFSLNIIAELKNRLPVALRTCSKVEILVAHLWKCRTAALGLDFDKEIGLSLAVNARGKFRPPLPVGFYGNAFGKPVVTSTAGELRRNTLGYTVKLIQRSKAEVTDEFMRSKIDQLEEMNQPGNYPVQTFHVSDLTKMRIDNVDFGWGRAVYGGPTGYGALSTFLVSVRNKEGEEGIAVIIDLPRATMEKFATAIGKTLSSSSEPCSIFLVSAL